VSLFAPPLVSGRPRNEERGIELADGADCAECTESKQCAPVKHHFDECVERVTGAGSDNKEDCVEECMCPPRLPCGWEVANLSRTTVFHLAHCASACAAPKLWSQLK
jgi:ubiquinol-cytochrome c reductase subunit 6